MSPPYSFELQYWSKKSFVKKKTIYRRALLRSLFFLLTISCYAIRSPHRPADRHMPTLHARFVNDTALYTLKNSHLEEVIFKIFDKKHFYDNLLPYDAISFRYEPNKSVLGKTLSMLIEELIIELQYLPKNQKKINFKHFVIIKDQNTENSDYTGLYILRFKDYPFILKLFIETPESFVDPLAKGLEPSCFFHMAGGISRHLLGFTRIKNLNEIKALVQADPYWNTKVDFPRKWFWLPKNPRWIQLDGYNIGPQKHIRSVIPGTYALICDEIVWKEAFTLQSPQQRDLVMALSNFLEHHIDSHINNFGFEQGQKDIIVPIDFERFPLAVGMDRTYFSGYFDWYLYLSQKAFTSLMFRNKFDRRQAQYQAYNGW